MLGLEVVVDSLGPHSGFVHHQIALGGIEFRRGAVGCILCVGVVVGVAIVQGEPCHLAVKVVHRGLYVGDGDLARCGLFRHFGECLVAFGEYRGNMAAGPVFVAVFVACAVVEVADVGVVADGVVELDHGVFGLNDVQFGEVGAHLLVTALLDILCKPYGTDKGACVGVVAFSIDAAHRHKLVEPCAVILAVYAGDTDAVGIGAAVQQCLPVKPGAVVEDEGANVAVGLQCQAAGGELREILEAQGGQGSRKPGYCQRGAFGEVDALDFRASRVEFLKSCLVAQVEGGARAAAGLGLGLVPQAESTQLTAVPYRQPPPGGAASLRRVEVEFAQHGAFAEVEGVLEVACRPGHVEGPYPAGSVETQGVVDGIGPGDVEDGGVAGIHDAGVGDVGAVVGAVPVGVGLVGRDPHGVGGVASCPGEVEVYVVGGEVARAVFGVEKGESVPDEVGAVALVAALQGVDEGPHLAVHDPRGRGDVFQVAALVEGAVAPVAALLVVEHRQHALDGHHGAVVGGAASEVVLEVGQHEVPQHAVEALHRVFAGLGIPCVAHGGVEVDKEAVVALA